MKVQDMTNEQLDYWVANAQGWKAKIGGTEQVCLTDFGRGKEPVSMYTPSTNWQQAGELIEKFIVGLHPSVVENVPPWNAYTGILVKGRMYADTPHRAICMAVIASVYGKEVEE